MAAGLMTLEDMTTSVIKLGHLGTDQTGEAQLYINDAYEMVWTAADWQFRKVPVPVTVASGSQVVTNLPSDLGLINGFWRGALGTGDRLGFVLPDVFIDRWSDNNTAIVQAGPPYEYTVIGSQVLVGPASNEAATDYTLLHERRFTPLGAGQTPALPIGTHMVVVYAAAATALVSENDFFFQFCDGRYQARMAAMQREYLVTTRDEPQHWPSAYESSGYDNGW